MWLKCLICLVATLCGLQQTGASTKGVNTSVKFVQTNLTNRNRNLTWDMLLGNITDSLSGVLNQALPNIIRATSEVEIGADCTAAMFQFFLELRKLTPWALRCKYQTHQCLKATKTKAVVAKHESMMVKSMMDRT
ncbi:nose resistant to fluoxetine protein 6-like [Tropilaelaps mercedesae]|uniref:Nose resistant to fluoxetine protein 6-like n=1 Tax=Tropilaelaps mercedesae TaxID=418985 RepID=A0A1V9X5H9_9ACAR|nr:nose resistant to fluoxetine protein 6-like [Tropilaelaps mercedesae]